MASPPQNASQAATPPSSTSPKTDTKKPHITDLPMTRQNWYKHINWLNAFFIIGIPMYGVVSAYSTPLLWQTAVWTVLYYFMTGLGITAGTF